MRIRDMTKAREVTIQVESGEQAKTGQFAKRYGSQQDKRVSRQRHAVGAEISLGTITHGSLSGPAAPCWEVHREQPGQPVRVD